MSDSEIIHQIQIDEESTVITYVHSNIKHEGFITINSDTEIPSDFMSKPSKYRWTGSDFEDRKLVEPPFIPNEMTKSKFITLLVNHEQITEEEAETWAVSNTLPTLILAAIAELPSADRLTAKLMLITDSTLYRYNPILKELLLQLNYSATIDRTTQLSTMDLFWLESQS